MLCSLDQNTRDADGLVGSSGTTNGAAGSVPPGSGDVGFSVTVGRSSRRGSLSVFDGIGVKPSPVSVTAVAPPAAVDDTDAALQTRSGATAEIAGSGLVIS